MKRALLYLVSIAAWGCASVPRPAIAERNLVGRYSNGDYWLRSLELNGDGTFTYEQLTDVIGENGQFQGNTWSFRGTWRLVLPDKIVLRTGREPSTITVYVRPSRWGHYAILEPDLYPGILSTWKDDTGARYLTKEEKEPNHSPDRMPGSSAPGESGRH